MTTPADSQAEAHFARVQAANLRRQLDVARRELDEERKAHAECEKARAFLAAQIVARWRGPR